MSEPGEDAASSESAATASSEPGAPTNAPAEASAAPAPIPEAATGYAATALRLHAEGKSRADILAELSAQGLDDESARIVLNTLPGSPQPHVLPEASIDMGKNPLAPDMFTISHLGLSGPPRVVGAYWTAFGAVLIVLFGLLLITAEWANPSPMTLLFARIGMGLGALAVVRGLWRIIPRR